VRAPLAYPCQVAFSYPARPRHAVLHGLSFTVNPGKGRWELCRTFGLAIPRLPAARPTWNPASSSERAP
jgi:hypothetical protein